MNVHLIIMYALDIHFVYVLLSHRLDNVTMEITQCPRQWPDTENCLKVRVAITLDPKTVDSKPVRVDDLTGGSTGKMIKAITLSPVPQIDDVVVEEEAATKPPPPQPALTATHLREMWLQFGQMMFAAADYAVSEE